MEARASGWGSLQLSGLQTDPQGPETPTAESQDVLDTFQDPVG